MIDLRGTTAGFQGTDEWEWRITRDGVETGERRRVSSARFASDMAHLIKLQLAEEQRQRPTMEALTKETQEHIGEELKEWLRHPLILERAQHSVARKVTPADLPVEAHILLVQHDWASAMDGAVIEGATDQVRANLPYPITVFEFSFRGGVRGVYIGCEFKRGDLSSRTFFRTKSGWLSAEIVGPASATNPLVKAFEIMDRNIQAICIMLEAQVAEATPMREPFRRNSRPAKGPWKKLSHHIVSLSRRVRLTPCDDHEPGTPKRLHFRRGHWRHYVSHRTWIKWTLVGNPDLGFVDKEYRL